MATYAGSFFICSSLQIIEMAPELWTAKMGGKSLVYLSGYVSEYLEHLLLTMQSVPRYSRYVKSENVPEYVPSQDIDYRLSRVFLRTSRDHTSPAFFVVVVVDVVLCFFVLRTNRLNKASRTAPFSSGAIRSSPVAV